MSLFLGLMRQERERMRLARLEEELRPAHMRGIKHCVKCGFCCNMRTCVPTPNEVKTIAKFLKITTKELINKYFAVDREQLKYVYYLKPVGENAKDLASEFIPAHRTFNEGPCIFLDKDNLCKIYPVRPQTARAMKCWLKRNTEFDRAHRKTLKSWEKNQLKKQFGIDGENLENNIAYCDDI